MTNYATGHAAELKAADYLRSEGFKIRAINWKTPVCEIDIVAERSRTVYFVEVKYRKTIEQGYGVDYVTPSKLKRMKFAADMWLAQSGWKGECQLAVVSIDEGRFTYYSVNDA